MIHHILTKKAPEPVGPYSQAVKAGDYLFISGQLGTDPETGSFEESIGKQTKQAIKNLIAIVETAGGNLKSIVYVTVYLSDIPICGMPINHGRCVYVTVYLSDIRDFSEMNKVYAEFFENTRPARVTVESPHLPKNARVEISAIAYIPGDKK